ncbi:MAG: PAS domain-containing sensor histidine kinase [Chloroflexota bacterium]|nr:PAS domain-containing sensor histidine kinase [Chloroflexota bacterium]
MSQIFAPLMPEYTIDLPSDPIALAAWVILLGLLWVLILSMRDKHAKINRNTLVWMAVLSVLVLVLTPFFGIPVEIDRGSPVVQGKALHIMFFAAVPWLAAGGIIGFIPAGLLAGMSGLLFAYLETHQIFTPLIFTSLALIFTWGVRQPYRTTLFRYLRNPFISALFSLIITTPLIFLTQVLLLPGEFPLRIAAALGTMPVILISYGGMLLSGSMICVLCRAFLPGKWYRATSLLPSPGEKSVKTRFLLVTVPILLGLLILLMGIAWRANVNSSRRDLVTQLVNASDVGADGWTVFVNTGYMALDEISEVVTLSNAADLDIQELIGQKMEENGFFNRLIILSPEGEIITIYPDSGEIESIHIPGDLLSSGGTGGKDLARTVSRSYQDDGEGGVLNFFKVLSDSSGQSTQLLLGQTNIDENRFSRAFTTAFASLGKINADGQILTRSGELLFNTGPNLAVEEDTGEAFLTPTFYETLSSDGLPIMQYVTPIEGTPWAVLTRIPTAVLYNMAWQRSYPVILIGVGILLVLICGALTVWTPVLKDIKVISKEMEKVADGSFDIQIPEPKSKGEVSQLFEHFHLMAGTLGNRLQKHVDLLSLNEEMSAHNNLYDSLRAIMESALSRDVSAVRLLLKDRMEDAQYKNGGGQYSFGPAAESYSHLDKEILALVRSQGESVLRDFQIGKRFNIKKTLSYPSTLIAMPMTWQGEDQGVFWVAYDEKKTFSAVDIDFFRSLSCKAAMIISKGISFDNAVTIKNRLEAILNILSDGILLLNGGDEVIYHNQSARLMLGLVDKPLIGTHIASLTKDQVLFDFILAGETLSEKPLEFKMGDGYICELHVSPIDFENQQKGKVVIFKDVTQAKEREMLESEFVTTASHELRSPLSLIHGYAKLLRLTGNLNEQQNAYINNINDGVEDLKKLVQNLLDIGRLESGHTLEIKRVSAQSLAKNVVASMQPFAKQKNIHLNLLLPDLLIEFDADEVFLAQAIKNLLENAIKFTKMGGDVSLSVRKNEKSVVFSVQDTGIGIAPLDQRHLFEKFKRLGTTLGQESKGSGLGLAIVKSIAERHGGKVWFESQLAKGSTFYLEIPLKYG